MAWCNGVVRNEIIFCDDKQLETKHAHLGSEHTLHHAKCRPKRRGRQTAVDALSWRLYSAFHA